MHDHSHEDTGADFKSKSTTVSETVIGLLNSVTIAQVLQAMSTYEAEFFGMTAWSLGLGCGVGVLLAVASAGTHLFLNKKYQPELQKLFEGRGIPESDWPLWLSIMYYYFKYGDFASHTVNYASAPILLAELFLGRVLPKPAKALGYATLITLSGIFAAPGEVRPCWKELLDGCDRWSYSMAVHRGDIVLPPDVELTLAEISAKVVAAQQKLESYMNVGIEPSAADKAELNEMLKEAERALMHMQRIIDAQELLEPVVPAAVPFEGVTVHLPVIPPPATERQPLVATTGESAVVISDGVRRYQYNFSRK